MITVIIPTYNRPLCINDFIDSIAAYSGELFTFQIHDSSDNCDTESIIRQRKPKKTIYIRHRKEEQFFEKLIKSLSYCDTDYFFLVGDGNVVDFNKLETDLLSKRYFEYELIGLNSNSQKKEPIIYTYDNLLQFAPEYFTKSTYWGFSILKFSLISNYLSAEDLKLYDDSTGSWWIGSVIMRGLCEKKGKSLILNDRYSFISKNKKDHCWAVGERYYLLTFKALNKIVFMLPDFYNDVKLEMIKVFRNDCLATKKYLIGKRASKTITLKLTKKYREDIKAVRGYYHFMLFLSIIPSFLIRFAYKIRRIFR